MADPARGQIEIHDIVNLNLGCNGCSFKVAPRMSITRNLVLARRALELRPRLRLSQGQLGLHGFSQTPSQQFHFNVIISTLVLTQSSEATMFLMYISTFQLHIVLLDSCSRSCGFNIAGLHEYVKYPVLDSRSLELRFPFYHGVVNGVAVP